LSYVWLFSVSRLTDVCFYTLVCGVVLSPFAGYVYELQKKSFSGKNVLHLTMIIRQQPIPLTENQYSSDLYLTNRS